MTDHSLWTVVRGDNRLHMAAAPASGYPYAACADTLHGPRIECRGLLPLSEYPPHIGVCPRCVGIALDQRDAAKRETAELRDRLATAVAQLAALATIPADEAERLGLVAPAERPQDGRTPVPECHATPEPITAPQTATQTITPTDQTHPA